MYPFTMMVVIHYNIILLRVFITITVQTLINQTINYGECESGEDLDTCCDRVSR